MKLNCPNDKKSIDLELHTVKKILLVSLSGIGEHYSGPAMSLYRLLKPLKDDFCFELLHCNEEQSTDNDLIIKCMSNVKINFTKQHLMSTKLKLCFFLVLSSFWLFFNARKYDIVMAPSLNFFTLSLLAIAKFKGCKVVNRVASFNSELGGIESKPWRIFNRIKVNLICQMDFIIAISSEIQSSLIKLGLHESSVFNLWNSVDLERFKPLESEADRFRLQELRALPELENKFWLLTVGAVGTRKGQGLVIESLSNLPKNVHYVIIGPIRDQGYQSSIDLLIKNNNLKERVHLIDNMDCVELAYPIFDLFLLPSLAEGMPNSMLEAMACGLVPVGANISGINDLINENEGRGRFVERSSASISAAVSGYLKNEKTLLNEKQRCIDYINEFHDSTKARKQFREFLNGL